MTDTKIQVNIQPSQEFYGNLLVTAFDGQYGGSWYWAQGTGTVKVDGIRDQADWLEVKITFDYRDAPTPAMRGEYYNQELAHGGVTINHEVLAVGIRRMLDEINGASDRYGTLVQALAESDAGEFDADDADAIVQYGLFGELVYG